MKIRVFSNMDNGVYRVVIGAEDWSEGDVLLMEQFGEPELDVGGTVSYEFNGETRSKDLGSELVRVLHGLPYARGFDSRDYESVGEAVSAGRAWKEAVVKSVTDVVTKLRANEHSLPTEEVKEI